MGKTKVNVAEENSSELATLREWLNGEFQAIKERDDKRDMALDDIKTGLEVLEQENFTTKEYCERLETENAALKREVSELQRQQQQQEAYTRRDNLRFYNIRDRPVEDTEQVLRDFTSDMLKIDGEALDFSIVHRLGPYKQGQSRCILARFVRRSDVIRVKAASVNLRGSTFGISDDLPAAWAALKRQAYIKYIKPARENKQRVR